MLKKIREKAKHFLAAVLSLATTGTGLAAITTQVASASGGEWELSLENEHHIGWNSNTYNTGNITRPQLYMTNKNTGERLEVFCIQLRVLISQTDPGYNAEANLAAWNSLSVTARQKISVAGLWYKQYYNGNYYASTATQYYIWTLTMAEQYGDTGPNWSEIRSRSSEPAVVDQVKGYYDELNAYMNGYLLSPSFSKVGNAEQDGSTYVLRPGTTITLHDNNGRFHYAEWDIDRTNLSSKLDVRKDGDNLIISLKGDYEGNEYYTVQVKRFATVSDKLLVFGATGQNGSGEQGQAIVYPGALSQIDPDVGINLHTLSGRIRVEKYDSITHESVAGATFEIHKGSETGEVVETLRTNYEGKAISDWIAYGDYVLVEKGVPTGYNFGINQNGQWTGTVKKVTLNQESVSVEFYNKPIQGTVKITKYDKDHPNEKIEGVVFDIHQISDKVGGKFDYVVGSITTNSDGVAVSGLLDYGDYYLLEKTAKFGFFNDQEKLYFSIHEEMEQKQLEKGNTQTDSEITIEKLDDNCDGYGLDDSGKKFKLAGAEFEVWEHLVMKDAMGNVVWTREVQVNNEPLVTDATGTVKFTQKVAWTQDLQQQGSYFYVKEIKAPVGYHLNKDPQRVDIQYQGQFVATVKVKSTFENCVVTAPISVKKVDKIDGTALAGAKFRVLDSKLRVVDEITTGADGTATTKDLRMGTYTIHEIEAPKDYNLDSAPVTVTLDPKVDANGVTTTLIQSNEAIFKNTPKMGKLIVNKVDALTVDHKQECSDPDDLSTCNEIIEVTSDTDYLPGAEFAIYKVGDLDTVIATGTTDRNGKYEVELRPGKYYLQETKAPEGYNVNPELVEFEIKADEETEELVLDAYIYGKLDVYKYGEELVGTKDGEDGITELVWHDEYEANAKFELIADEDIKNPVTGKVAYEKDEVVREMITDETGKASVDSLPIGKYCVKEVIAPEEHSIGEESVQCFEIKEEDADMQTGVVESEMNFKNERLIIDPTIYKQAANLVNKEDESEGYTNADLAGAKFGIYNSEEIVSNDEKTKVAADTLLATMITKEDGTADVEIKLPFGKYYVKEIEAPEGYHLNEDKYDFELTWDQKYQDLKEGKLVVNVSDKENPIINYEIVMPKTGVSNVIYYAAGIGAIALGGLAIIIAKRRKVEA